MTTAPSPLPAASYPVRVTARLDDHLSRWLWLVKWLLVLPHAVVLAFLWVGWVVLTLVAMVAIVVTGRYPRALFEYDVGVLRWTWRVAYYAYGALGTDQYPPFTLADRPDYPARLDVVYPEHLSRGLALVKWWLLAVPHYLVVGLFLGGGAWVATSEEGAAAIGLVGLLVLFAGVALLVRGQYPRSIFDFVLGMNRWALRVAAYAGLMTDRYPPFRLDLGGDDPASMTVGSPPPVPPTPVAPPHRSAWTGGRITSVVVGSVGLLVGLGLTAGGIAALALDGPGRDANGYLMTDTARYTTSTAALSARLELPVEGVGWFSSAEQLGAVRLEVRTTSDRPVFLAVAARDDASTYLAGTAYEEVTELGPDPVYERVGGRGTAAPAPADQPWWVASAQGTGRVELTWPAAEGDWSVLLLNADGTPGVAADVRAGATLPHLDDVGWGLLGAAAVVLVGSGLAVGLAAHGAARR